MSSKNKQFRDLVKRCEAVGWSVRATKKNHILVVAHNGQPYTIPGTSHGYGTAFKNALAWCRRQGLEELEREQQSARN